MGLPRWVVLAALWRRMKPSSAARLANPSGAVPAEGQAFSFHGFRFEVLEREGNRLTRLKVRKLV